MDVLYEDAQLLVVRKPAETLAQPDHTGDLDVLTLGKRHLSPGNGEPFLGLVHRLDRPTSGLMVLAKTSAAARHLSRQFRERTAQKQYLALVDGVLRGIGTWQDYIAKPDRTPMIVGPDHPDGKRAALDWQALHRADERTLLSVQLHTGRPHQIRLQAAERGAPVVGDTRYGGPAIASDGGIALHHAILRVDHPSESHRKTFVDALPTHWTPLLTDDMRAAAGRVLARARPG
ncbi:MAG: RluA family pseudouridine synthase [Bacteroidetes bacterium SW_9_63_38]|nr:MAG: RluA family pseudouridine synthase [Bacteroidetes bacterium SW_9_63_38]